MKVANRRSRGLTEQHAISAGIEQTAEYDNTPPGGTSPRDFGGSWSIVQSGTSVTGTFFDMATWQVSGTNINSAVTLNASSPSGGAPGFVQASTIKEVFSAACKIASGTETLTFPPGTEGGSGPFTYPTTLARLVVPAINFSFDPNGGASPARSRDQAKARRFRLTSPAAVARPRS